MRTIKFFERYFDIAELPEEVRIYLCQELTRDGRHYHGVGHIALMLKHITTAYDRVTPRETYRKLVLAALFHDIVYDPTRSDNEERSAIEMRLRVPPTVLYRLDVAENMILATKTHIPDRRRGNIIDMFIAADLSILWSNPKQYKWYAHGIRKEYAFVPNDVYREKRLEVLVGLKDTVKNTFNAPIEGVNIDGLRLIENFKWERDALAAGELDV